MQAGELKQFERYLVTAKVANEPKRYMFVGVYMGQANDRHLWFSMRPHWDSQKVLPELCEEAIKTELPIGPQGEVV